MLPTFENVQADSFFNRPPFFEHLHPMPQEEEATSLAFGHQRSRLVQAKCGDDQQVIRWVGPRRRATLCGSISPRLYRAKFLRENNIQETPIYCRIIDNGFDLSIPFRPFL